MAKYTGRSIEQLKLVKKSDFTGEEELFWEENKDKKNDDELGMITKSIYLAKAGVDAIKDRIQGAGENAALAIVRQQIKAKKDARISRALEESALKTLLDEQEITPEEYVEEMEALDKKYSK